MTMAGDSSAAGRLLDQRTRRRQVTRLMHAHLSPGLWRDPTRDARQVLALRDRVAAHVPKRLNLYVGTPYCLPTNPDRCGFCLFPSEEYRGKQQLDDYVRQLHREGEIYERSFEGTPVESVYFGGGTSNLYRPEVYPELLQLVRRVVNLGPDAEVTLEGIPQVYTEEKLAAMKQAGINRISIGVQQFDDELIKLSGRKQTYAHTVRVLEWCRALGLRTSVDLIFGWPRQTIDAMLRNLEVAVRHQVGHITHYELNVGGRTDFAENHADTLPSIEQNLEMYHAAHRYLSSAGYEQVSTYDWRKADGKLRYEEDSQPFFLGEDGALRGRDTWGWGFAGVSRFLGSPAEPGWMYMNHDQVKGYCEALDRGEFPIRRAHRCSATDLELILLFQLLITKRVDRALFRTLFASDVFDDHRGLWEALAERGWLVISPDELTLVGDGVFFTPTIQGLLAERRVQEIQRSLLPTARSLPIAP